MQNLLWEKLQQFDLDGGVPFTFSRRLARDNGWSHEFALRVCEEYKKFLYLACTAGHVVSPSEGVDQAWHLHLTYTRSYWEELCPKVLGMPLHHDPSRGRKSEAGKFEALYEQTLDSYQKAFDAPAPRDIWPPTAVRFGEVKHFRRVNLKRNYVIARPRLSLSNVKLVPALSLVAILAGCSATGSLNPYNWYGGEFLAFFWTLGALAVLFYCWLRHQLSGPHDERFPTTRLDPYVLGRLSNSGHLPVDAALCALQSEGLITVDATGIIQQVPGVPAPPQAFERRVWEQVRISNRLAGIRSGMRPLVEQFDQQLQSDGLLLKDDQRTTIQGTALCLAAILLTVGVIKICIGLDRGRPVTFLVLSCIAVLIVAVLAVTTYAPHRTRRGDLYLRDLRATIRQAAAYDPSLVTSAIVVGAALWGYGQLQGYGFASFQRQPPSSGGDSGGGDSGGGGDGGCGGGGGCGGCGGGD